MAPSGASPITRLDETPPFADDAANIQPKGVMAKGQATTCIKLRAGRFPAHVFAPSHFAGILAEMGPGDVMMLADLRAAEPGEIALRLVRAGAIRAIGLAMIDPLHLEASMESVPSSCLVGVDDAPSGDAPANDRHGLGLMLHDGCHGRAATLAHHHDAKPLAVLVFAPTPIDPCGAMIFWPDMTAKPSAIDLNDPVQSGRCGVRCQSASQLVK